MTPAELLIQAYFEGSLSDAETDALHAWLVEDSAHVDRFAIECLLHGQLRELLSEQAFRKDLLASALAPPRPFVPEQAAVRPKSRPLRSSTPRSPVPGFLHRMMHVKGKGRLKFFLAVAGLAGLFLVLSLTAIVPAYLGLRRAELENAQREQREAQERLLAASKAQEEQAAERKAKQASRAMFDEYAKLLSTWNPLHTARAFGDSAAWVYSHGLAQARLTFGVDCRWGGTAPDVGEALTLGRRLQLKSGLAEIVFQNGARTILQGPATLQIIGGSGAFLQVGRFTVNVENAPTKGFEVGTPGMKYTDLGTEFGVVVDADGEQEMHVFRGKVQAEVARDERSEVRDQRSGDLRPLTSDIRPLILAAHEAIRVAVPAEQGKPATPIKSIAADEKQFVRNIPRDRFPLFSTGVGLDQGAADPHWEITKFSTDKSFKAQPAVIVKPLASYPQDARYEAHWISNSKELGKLPAGCRWTLRTHFDLKGFDASSARIEGRLSIDDYLVEIRLNGQSMQIPQNASGGSLCMKWYDFKLDTGFVDGDNTLEIVIENQPDSSGGAMNTMALCVDWKGAARKLVKFKGGD